MDNAKIIKNPNSGKKWYYCPICHRTFKQEEFDMTIEHDFMKEHEIRTISPIKDRITIYD